MEYATLSSGSGYSVQRSRPTLSPVSRVSADPGLGLNPLRLGREVADCEVLIDARHCRRGLSIGAGLKLDECFGARCRIRLGLDRSCPAPSFEANVCLQR